ncbi:MAG TPA: exonuclease SbcCD subunit D [Thermomicrobiaceae bacterium]|nr:exonuclease SbcCD subunit D [Thermomicrobiaceae bacterium]
MRILHFADLHLGMENYGSLDPRTGLSSRVTDYLAAFDQVVDFALHERVDAVLFAGDAFKNRDPNPTVQREFARRVRRLASAGIPTVLLIGNHDLPSIDARATAIDIYDALGIPNVIVARRPSIHRIDTATGPLQVVALPWLQRSRLLTPEERRQAGTDEGARRLRELVASVLEELLEQVDPSIPSILLAHLSIEGARLGSEQSIMLGEDLVLGTDELRVRAFDYVALGHIHQHQQITARPPTVYAGSIERIDFGEEAEEKGFVVIEIKPVPAGVREVIWTFHPVSARRFLTLRVKACQADPLVDVRREIERRASEINGAVVRAFVELPGEREDLLRVDDVRNLLQEAGAAHVAKVVREIENQARPRIDLSDHESLDPVVALEKWLGLRDQLSLEQRGKVLARGLELIRDHRAGV